MSAPIYIAVYRPREGNYLHWAVFIRASKCHIHEVTGKHPNFSYNYMNADPASTGRHRENVLVGYVQESDISKINSLLPQVQIENGNSGWTCQDWVIEALEGLCSEYILDEEDEDYINGVEAAKSKYFGPQ